jgi:hypothetical protein
VGQPRKVRATRSPAFDENWLSLNSALRDNTRMPVLTTPHDLLTALGKSPFSTDPVADLARHGYTLGPELNTQLQSALKGKKLALPPSGVTPATFKGTLTFQETPQIAPQAPPAAGNYDALAGLTMAAANIAIDAVYQSGSIPHEIALDQLLSADELNELAGFFKVDRQGGQLSRLRITSSPTLTGAIDGSPIVALHLPIQLDWVRLISTPITQIRQLITTATGTLQLTAALVANVVPRPQTSGSTMTIGAQLDTEVSSAADSPRLTLDPSSPVQLTSPAPPNQIDGTAVLIQNVLAQELGNELITPVSPSFNLPTGSLTLHHVDIVSKGGMLLAGLQMEGTGTTAATDPTKLTSLLPGDGSNLYLQIQDSVANALIQTALKSGQLTALAQAKNSNAVVDSASASFQNNAFVAQISGRLVNECPLWVDLAFIDTRTVSLKLNGGTLQIDQNDDNSVAELSNLWCLLTSLGLIGLAVLAGAIFGGWLAVSIGGILGFILTGVGPFLAGQIVSGLLSGGGPDSTIVDLTQPIPGSNSLPTLSGGFFQITNGAILIGAIAGTQSDNINTIIYVRFLVPAGGIEITTTKALSGVKVELMDQDVPPPPGDDASTQVPPPTSSGQGKHAVNISYAFVPPTSDQQLGVGTTDVNGVVRFGLLKEQLITTAGQIKKSDQHFDPDADRVITTITETPVPEAKPDLYFRVTLPDGSVVDTRGLPGGFLLNFTSARIGTLANPLTFTFGPTVGGTREATTA